ncbi:MAG: ester cyclase [Chloroflexi bacterium]|nr:ester cyclase [Chloroflexota bacterium]
MSIQDNIKLDDEFIASWNNHDADRSLAVLSDDVVWNDVSTPNAMRGKAAVREYIKNWFTPFPDMTVVVKNRVATEDQIAAELEFTGTNTGPLQMAPGAPTLPATGKTIHGKGTYFVRFRSGKAVEIHTYPDMAGMMMQLGLAPMPGK